MARPIIHTSLFLFPFFERLGKASYIVATVAWVQACMTRRHKGGLRYILYIDTVDGSRSYMPSPAFGGQ